MTIPTDNCPSYIACSQQGECYGACRGNSAFDGIFDDAFSGLKEYYPSQLTDAKKETLKAAVRPVFEVTGTLQGAYERVRDAIEMELSKVDEVALEALKR